jgi:hypothetical protein
MCRYTVEPLNKGHYEANDFVPRREVVPISEVTKVQHGVETSVLCREVVPISEGPLSEVPL